MANQGELNFEHPVDGTLTIRLTGSWKLDEKLPFADPLTHRLPQYPDVQCIQIDARQVDDWDSGLLVFLACAREITAENNLRFKTLGVPAGATRLLQMATALPEKKQARNVPEQIPFLKHLGNETVGFCQSCGDLLEFVGEASMALAGIIRGKVQFRQSDFASVVESCSWQALPIVTLISFLVGLILAFMASIQLAIFGAEIFVADLVGLGMVRFMAAIMTGVVMAGRSGGAFAAQLGTMQVNQEIDALRTLGISPMEFLVLPRMLGLTVMMPLLTLYANIMGILGGAIVGVASPNANIVLYYHQTVDAVSLWDLGIGLFSSAVFGMIVSLSGCMRGMQCGRSSSAVGDAATSAVVTAIVGIVVATAFITVTTSILGI